MNVRLSGTVVLSLKADFSPNLGTCKETHGNWNRDRFIHPFIQKLLIENLLCARHCVAEGTVMQKTGMMPLLTENS